MNLALRYADPETARNYPLDCRERLEWHSTGNVHSAGIKLTDISAGSIIVPSFALLCDDDYQFQFVLRLGATCWHLHPVPCESAPEPQSNPAVSTHIDCFHVHQAVCDAKLELQVIGPQAISRFLVTVTARPLELDDVAPPRGIESCPPPPALSQMSLGEKLGPRVCSPACTTMLLARFGKDPDLAAVSNACFDPVSKLYGIWPLALRAASRAGCLGAVEVFDDWHAPQQVLSAGLPVIASIRFAEGGLPDAPLKATPGHLVVVHGIGPSEVFVYDPAAADAATVPRTYPTADFGRAWLQHRGAAYILLP
ncbi:MAG: C39 family peptidase [Gammaproteobacteria bacterium]|nr:C39 family peptidase [Gammaproteobacteria bacterium]